MGWSGYPLAANDDLQLASKVSQVWSAWNERRQMIGQATVTVPAADADVFTGAAVAGGISEIQDWIATYIGSFVQSHTLLGVPRGAGYWASKTALDFWTLPNILAASGHAQTHFTRINLAGATVYGVGQPDDLIQPALFNELHDVLSLMQMISAPGGLWTKLTDANNELFFGFGTDDATWNGAKATTHGSFDVVAQSTSSDPPLAYTSGQWVGGPTPYTELMRRVRQFMQFSGLPTFINSDLEFYALARAVGGDWKANGDGLTQDAFTLIETQNAGGAATRNSANRVGSLGTGASRPADPAAPDAVTPGTSAGYQCDTPPIGVLNFGPYLTYT